MHFVYMNKNSADSLYVGISENPEERVQYHNSQQGAKFTKYIPDFRIAFIEEHADMTSARRREIQIKKWRREKKEMLIDRGLLPNDPTFPQKGGDES
jgi:putative endonuclease